MKRYIAGLALLLIALAAHAAPLRVCLLTHNLPYSARDPLQGFDLDTARLLAAALGRDFEPVWTDNPATIQEVEETDIPLHKLAREACDTILSVPGPARDTLKRLPKLALGNPYYGAAFELIGPPGLSAELKTLREQPVAIQAQTVASFALVMLQGKQRTFFAPRPALESVIRGDAVAALLWGPTAGWYLLTPSKLPLAIASGYQPPAALAWNLHAATRVTDEPLRSEIDSALAKLAADGSLNRLATKYGFRLHAPFAVTYSLTEINKLR